MIESEIFKVAEAVMLDRNKFSSTDYEDLINAMKEKEKETASLLLPQFENFEVACHPELKKMPVVTYLEKRKHQKRMLVYAFRLLAKYKWIEGVAGHITVRDPEFPDTFWVNPMGRYFGALLVKDLIRVDRSGSIIEGKGTLNKAAFAIHSAIHEARPDVVAACHAHTPYAKVWSTTGRLLDPLTQDSCTFYEDHALDNVFTGVVFGKDDGLIVAKCLGNKKVILLRNHGHVAVGETVESAIWSFISFERCCKAQIRAESISHFNETKKPHLIDHHTALLTRQQVGSQYQCWFQCQSEIEALLCEYPELRDI